MTFTFHPSPLAVLPQPSAKPARSAAARDTQGALEQGIHEAQARARTLQLPVIAGHLDDLQTPWGVTPNPTNSGTGEGCASPCVRVTSLPDHGPPTSKTKD